MTKKTKAKSAKTPNPKKSKPLSKVLGYTPREGGRPKLDNAALDKLHGRKGLPPVAPKYLPKGEEDYGQATFDPAKKHLTVAEFMKLLSKIPNPDKKRVWFEGSQYWGKLTGLRLFDLDGGVLLEKGN